MVYNVFTPTDYIDALDQLVEVLTSRALTAVTVNAGGTGHAVGDVIDITVGSGVSTHVAQLEVTNVSSGVIQTGGVRIYRGGAYTTDPTPASANAQSATTGAGTGATFDLTFSASNSWSQLARQSVASSAVVAAGGSGYTNGSTDVLTLVGGVVAPGGSAATFTATASGGAVTSVALLSAGDYEVIPTNPVLTTVSPSGGTGCTLTVTWANKTGDTIVTLQGDAGSATDPLIGIKTYQELDETGLNTTYNWALFGMSSWSNQFGLHEQANVTPGFNTSAGDGSLTTSSGTGAFVPLKDSSGVAMTVEVRHTGRTCTVISRVEGGSTVYSSQCSFGLLNQFGTSTELPFPAYVCGASDRKKVWYRDTASIFGGISNVLQLTNGPLFVWSVEGVWLEGKASLISGVQDTAPSTAVANDGDRVTVWPVGPNSQRTGDDQNTQGAGTNGFDNEDLSLSTGATQIYRTPDTGGDLFPLFPVTIEQNDSSGDDYRVFGALDGVWFIGDNDAGLTEGDRIEQGSNAYAIHQNGTLKQPHDFLALEES